MQGTPFERRALHDVTLHIPDGTFFALIGHTGSGKSTLIQHLNGLLKPSAGSVQVGETVIEAGRKTELKTTQKKSWYCFSISRTSAV